jgi:hypothetical protein
MPAQLISMSDLRSQQRHAAWSLLEIARPGFRSEPLGVLLVDAETDRLTLRLRPSGEFEELEEQASDILDLLADDLAIRAREMGARQLLASLEDSLSGFFRITDRTEIAYSGDPQRKTDKLFDEYVDSSVRPFVTHLPVYQLRAAATKFGEGMSADETAEDWVRAPEGMRLDDRMFAVWVVGRSMEPLIPDGSLCAFRANVVGSRQNKRLLIEKFDETDFASRYTVKRYTSVKKPGADGEDFEHQRIRLEPLNPDFDAFDLAPDAFRVVGEFVAVLE